MPEPELLALSVAALGCSKHVPLAKAAAPLTPPTRLCGSAPVETDCRSATTVEQLLRGELDLLQNDLPPELVAQYPASPRSASRLLHLDGASGACRDMKFADLPALLAKFPQLKLASIGPETSKALAALGLKPTMEADPHTIEGLVESLTAAS